MFSHAKEELLFADKYFNKVRRERHLQRCSGKTNLTAAKLIDYLQAVLTVQSLIKQFFTIYTQELY